MLKWSNELEHEIRDLGDYVEKQMKDLLNPKASVTGSALRIVFRAVAEGKPLLDNIKRFENDSDDFLINRPRNNWLADLKMLADLADANGSNAADKIKKALPVANELTDAFKAEKVAGIRGKIKYAKAKGLAY